MAVQIEPLLWPHPQELYQIYAGGYALAGRRMAFRDMRQPGFLTRESKKGRHFGLKCFWWQNFCRGEAIALWPKSVTKNPSDFIPRIVVRCEVSLKARQSPAPRAFCGCPSLACHRQGGEAHPGTVDAVLGPHQCPARQTIDTSGPGERRRLERPCEKGLR